MRYGHYKSTLIGGKYERIESFFFDDFFKSKLHETMIASDVNVLLQVEENVRCIQLLIPLACAHATCNLSTCILIPISWFIFSEKPIPNIYFDFIPFYYLLLPIVFFTIIHKWALVIDYIIY